MDDDLISLLPATYRVVDARADGGDGFLQALLALVGGQVAELQADLDQLYEDLFIETCEPWVVPYIGELLGVTPAHTVAGVSETTRARVAHTIASRRRKGTAAVLEELANDVTGWKARAVEMFERLATTQHLNHVRDEIPAFVSLRGASALERLGGPFDGAAHTAEVRWVNSGRGRYNVPNVAIFVWPVEDTGFTDVEPVAVGDGRFRFHPLGFDTPLTTNPEGERDIAQLAQPLNVPLPISRRALHDDLPREAGGPESRLYGDNASVLVEIGGVEVPAHRVVACALEDGPLDSWENVGDIAADEVAVDPRRGRLVVGTDFDGDEVIVSFHQVSGGPLGGGSYHRPLRDLDGRVPTRVSRADPIALNRTIADGLTAVGGAGLVVVADSRTYTEALAVAVPANEELELRAADTRFPVVRLPEGGGLVTCGDGASVVLDGLLLTGGPLVIDGRPRHVEIRHCTLVPGLALDAAGEAVRPGEASLVVQGEPDAVPTVTIVGSITGPLLLPPGCPLTIVDSIVAGGDPQAHPAAPVLPVLLGGPGGPGGLVDVVGPVEDVGPDVVDLGVVGPAEVVGPEVVGPEVVGVAVSRPLEPLPALGGAPNRLVLLVGNAAGDEVDVGPPADLDALAVNLTGPVATSDRQALAADDRLVLVGRHRRPLSVRAAAGDATATTLGLDADDVARWATVGEPRPGGALALSAAQPRLGIRTGAEPLVEVTLGGTPPADLDAAADALQTAVRGLSLATVHAEAIVVVVDDALVLIPGAPEHVLSAGPTAGDPTTAAELGLAGVLPAVGSDGMGFQGPILTAERSTFLGRVSAEVVDLASDCIFAAPLVARRSQEGCARYSYVAPGSRPPRRHHCLPSDACHPVLAFASTRYGDPAFATLVAIDAAAAIRRGASNGSEMGAFSRFQHRQRENNLIFDLDEFLRFGLEAGILDGR